jgi:transcriptional regulator with XRE-family HTH domain
VHGLRREEVALLASISTEYYTRIEQGRLQASASLLDEIARVLRLNTAQRIYLSELAAKQTVHLPPSGDRQQVDTQLRRMLDDLTATPAFVIGRRTDILGWNQLAAALWTDFGRYPEQERVFLRLLFTEPWMRELYADWEEVTRLAIAHLRMESARYPGEPRLAALVEELSALDAQFRQWWTEHDVAMRDKGTKKLRHPVVGELTLDWNTLTCGTDPEQHIIVWNAEPGSPSHDGLRLLASWAAGHNTTTHDTVA